MKIAVTYENGSVFQHFGHTEQFKIYTIENNIITASQILGTDGAGHESLAVWLKQAGVNKLICGGIGGGDIAVRELKHEVLFQTFIPLVLLIGEPHLVFAADELRHRQVVGRLHGY